MKRFLSLLLTLCLIFALSASLASCGHDCRFSDRQFDDEYHWYACEIGDCKEISKKEEHNYTYDGIVELPSQEQDGEKAYSCDNCRHVKTEVVRFTGMTEAAWNAAFASSVFENFEYNEAATVKTSGITVDTAGTYKFTENDAWVSLTAAGQTNSSRAPSEAAANAARNELVNSIKSIAQYGMYVYDYSTKTYKSAVPVEIASLDASTTDVTLTFTNGKLTEIKYTIEFVKDDMDYTADETITISYGNVTIP